MHRIIIETNLAGLNSERASYFGDIANRLQADARTEPIANMVFTVLGDVMSNLRKTMRRCCARLCSPRNSSKILRSSHR